MKPNDEVAFTTASGETIHGQFIERLDADTVLVRVGERNVRVAATACWKIGS